MNARKLLFFAAAITAAAAATSTAHATWRYRTAVVCPDNSCVGVAYCMYQVGIQCSMPSPTQCNNSLCQPD